MMVKKILRIIESIKLLDINDTVKLSKIDYLVHEYIFGNLMSKPFTYTKSRDIIKGIRPKGFWFQIIPVTDNEWNVTCSDVDDGPIICSGYIPSEELAELHATLQAIDYVRRKISK